MEDDKKVKEMDQKDSSASIKTVVEPVQEDKPKKKSAKKSTAKKTAKKATKKVSDKEEVVVASYEEEKVVKEAVIAKNDEVKETIEEVKETIEEAKEDVKREEVNLDKDDAEKEVTFNSKEIIILVFAVALVSIAIGLLCGKILYQDSVVHNDFLRAIEENYKDIKETNPDVNDDELLKGAVNGMLGSIGDPYATILEDNSTFMIEVDGEYKGLGMEITTLSVGEVYVSKVFPKSGAEDAGILVGDKILGVDDVMLDGTTGSAFSDYILNSKNNKFTVHINRDGKDMDFVVVKKNVTIPSVIVDTIESNGKSVTYMDISIFSGTTYNQFANYLKSVDTSNGLIIDLRGNTGGRLDIVTEMLSELLDSGKIIYQTDTAGNIEKFYSTGKKDFEDKIIVLVDHYSASASEIMAAALQQNLEAILVGTTTYGKGTVQQVKTLSNGLQYKITTKKWLTPNGTGIDGVGVKPDYEVEQSQDYYINATYENDAQLQKALEILTK